MISVYNVDQVAELLQTSSIKVRELIKAGKLKSFHVGRCLINEDAILEFIKSEEGFSHEN